MKTLRFALMIALSLAALSIQARAATETHTFTLGETSGTRQEFSFRVPAVGTIRVEARWTGDPAKLTLILNGPGQTAYYQRREDRSPLVIVQDVTEEILRKGQDWKVSVVNFGPRVAVSGTMTITYPETFPERILTQFDRIAISRVEVKGPDRALVHVSYDIQRPHTRDLFAGATVLRDGVELASFGFRPVRLGLARDTAVIEVLYHASGTSGRATSDEIAVFIYEEGRKPHVRAAHEVGIVWYSGSRTVYGAVRIP